MLDNEEKERHSKRRKKNIVTKMLFDPGDHRGAFALKIIHPKKTTYKRQKININKILEEDNDE